MAKRFTATEKWVDPWFCELQPLEKLFWVYLLDNCNHAGIWQVNWPLIRFQLGEFEFDPRVFNDRIKVLSEEKWYIAKFVEFQYGELNPQNRAHLSVIHILEKEGALKGLLSPLDRGKDKDMDKDKVKDISPAQEIYDYYAKQIKPGAKEDAIKSISKLLKSVSKEDLIGRIDRYHAQLVKNPTEAQFYIQANNFFGKAARWKDFEPIKIVEYLPPDKDCKACKGQGKLQTGEGQIIKCKCVKEKL